MKNITTEKMLWIRKHLKRGDYLLLIKEMPEVNYSELTAILNGRLWGEHGQKVIDTTIEFLQKRIKQEKDERKRYAAMIQDD